MSKITKHYICLHCKAILVKKIDTCSLCGYKTLHEVGGTCEEIENVSETLRNNINKIINNYMFKDVTLKKIADIVTALINK